MKNNKKRKNYMSSQEFIAELARRTQMSEEKANEVMTAILEILDESWSNNQPVYFDKFNIQLTRDFPDKHPKWFPVS